MEVTLVSFTPNPVDTIELAASTCYDSSPTRGKIMNHCYKSGHHSVLEFAEFHFLVTSLSRASSHQLVRHRIASFAQRSQRYVKEDFANFVTPNSINYSSLEIKQIYDNTIDIIMDSYKKLIELGIPKEDARYLLPNATETEINVKMNLRSLINFCNERLCSCAQLEIRTMAEDMRNLVLEVMPEAIDMLVPKCEKHKPYCFCTESKSRTCGLHPLISDCIKAEN